MEGNLIDTAGLVEIRWHGRGGQGAVTSTELLARAAINEGVVGLGGSIFSAAFGALSARYGLPAPFIYTPVVVGIALLLQFLLLRLGRARLNERALP